MIYTDACILAINFILPYCNSLKLCCLNVLWPVDIDFKRKILFPGIIAQESVNGENNFSYIHKNIQIHGSWLKWTKKFDLKNLKMVKVNNWILKKFIFNLSQPLIFQTSSCLIGQNSKFLMTKNRTNMLYVNPELFHARASLN